MNGPDFFQTHMGRTFYEGTLPRLIKQLERLNDNLDRIATGLPAGNDDTLEKEKKNDAKH